jgi:hypothetical protein
MIRSSVRTRNLERKLAKARFRVSRFTQRALRDPRGGLILVGSALAEMTQIRLQIATEQLHGSHRHDKITIFQRGLSWFLPMLDGSILFWFLVGVLNVDLRRFDFLLVVAAALALLCTIAIAAWTAALGERLQIAKSDTRGLIWDAVDTIERGMLTITIVMALLIGAMMYVRVEDEIYQATGLVGATAIVIALTLAAAVVILNLYILHLAFADGSSLTRRADQLARRVHPHVRRCERNQALMHRIEEQIRQLRDSTPDDHLPLAS